MKTTNLVWSVSLIVIGICTVILAGGNLLGVELPDYIVRTIGLIDLIALPVLGYSTVKKVKNRQ